MHKPEIVNYIEDNLHKQHTYVHWYIAEPTLKQLHEMLYIIENDIYFKELEALG